MRILPVFLCSPLFRLKGALSPKVARNQNSRRPSIPFFQTLLAGQMTADGKSLDTTMTEPGFHFLSHFDRLEPEEAKPK